MARPFALITGGTSGIGLAAAKELIAERDLALIYRQNRPRAEAARDALLAQRPGAKILLIEADLNGYENGARAYEAVKHGFGSVPEILIHCSGRGNPALFVAAGFSEVMSVVNEHLVAALALTHLVLPDMYRQKTGKIIFISSVAAQAPQAGQAAYAAAKGALESFTRALSQEVSQRGIMVNCIAPGLTDTPMGAIHIAKAKEQGRTVQVHLPEEVARIIKFLCSAEASEVSGKTLTV